MRMPHDPFLKSRADGGILQPCFPCRRSRSGIATMSSSSPKTSTSSTAPNEQTTPQHDGDAHAQTHIGQPADSAPLPRARRRRWPLIVGLVVLAAAFGDRRSVDSRGAEHGFDRRCLRQRSRDVRRAARCRPGSACARRRQQRRPQGRPARRTRSGAVSGAGQYRPGRRHGGEGRSRGRAGVGARQRRIDAELAIRLGACDRRRGRQESRRSSCESQRSNRRRRRSPRPKPTTTATSRWSRAAPSRSRIWTPTPRRCWSPRRKCKRRCRRFIEIRVSLGLPPQPETGDDLTQVPADLNQNVFVRSRGTGEADAGGRGAGRHRFVQSNRRGRW